jgi:gas vesicle protein
MDNGTNSSDSSGSGVGPFFLGVLVGAVVGGVAALLLAPKSGSETREMVRNRYNQMKDAVRSSSEDVKQNFQSMKE